MSPEIIAALLGLSVAILAGFGKQAYDKGSLTTLINSFIDSSSKRTDEVQIIAEKNLFSLKEEVRRVEDRFDDRMDRIEDKLDRILESTTKTGA